MHYTPVRQQMMKRLLLLFLLTSWSQLCSSAPKCDTGIVLSYHILNIAGSQRAKATVDFVYAYNSTSLQSCLDDCCSGKYGSCSIATYRNQSKDVNCLYFYCRPLSHCKFYPSLSSDSYSFPATELRNDADVVTAPSQIFKNLQSAIYNLKEHARSVSARKGVENVVVSRKGVLPENVTVDFLSMKNDNTTVKPRKGVEFIPDVATEPTSSVIDLKEVTQEEQAKGGRTKIKPRKGVESLSPNIAPTRTLADTPALRTSMPKIDTLDQQPQSSLTPVTKQDSELMSMLQNVFRDDTNTSESSNKVPQSSIYVPHGSSSLKTIPSSKASLPFTPSVHLQTSMFIHPTASSNVPQSSLSNLLPSNIASDTYPVSSFPTAQLLTSSCSSDSIQSIPRSSTSYTYPESLSMKMSSRFTYPASLSLKPSSRYTYPASLSIKPSSRYTYPASLSIKPSSRFTYPASSSIEPSSRFTYPASLSIKPSSRHTYPASLSLEPSSRYTYPASLSIKPSSRFTYPASLSIKPSSRYTYPASLSIKPSSRYTYPASLSIKPSSRYTYPASLSIEPSSRFTYPASLSIKPSSASAYYRITATPAVMSSASFVPPPSAKVADLAVTSSAEKIHLLQGPAVDEETENERRYRSSMHLVISLVFGLIVLFAVMGAVAKRIYDVWMRRHYHRMDFLIDGMYDGYS